MNNASIGRRIKLCRQNAGMTQDALAKALGCTVQHIGAIERGVKTPRLDTFVAIANALGVSADLLLQDVLCVPVDTVADSFAAATAALSPELQARVLRALRSFSQEIE